MVRLQQIRLFLSILAVATLVVAMDVMIMPILSNLYHLASATAVLAYDFSIMLVAGLAGLLLARRIDCPVWWRQGRGPSPSHRADYVIVLLGLCIVILNALNNIVNIEQARQIAPWMALLTPETAIALSFRAALNEETIFRLFLFSLVAWIAMRLVGSRRVSLVLGALVSALVFGLIHGVGFVLAFSFGLAFAYMYFRRGLLAVMTVHFLANAIPFVVVSAMV